MGHTIPPKRQIAYHHLQQLEKFASTLRKPYRERLEQLIHSAYHHVSGVVYTNGLDDDELTVYAMLAGLAQLPDYHSSEKVRKCLSILLAGD